MNASTVDPAVDYLSLAALSAAMKGQGSVVAACLLAGADPNAFDAEHHRTTLCWLAFRDLVDVIPLALRCGGSPAWQDADGYDYVDLLSAKPDGHGQVTYPAFPVGVVN